METKDLEIENLHALLKELRTTNRFLKKQVSYRVTFVRGIFNGLGAAIGATLVLSIFFSLAIWSLSQLQFIPLIGTFAAEIVKFVQSSPVNGTSTKLY